MNEQIIQAAAQSAAQAALMEAALRSEAALRCLCVRLQDEVGHIFHCCEPESWDRGRAAAESVADADALIAALRRPPAGRK